MTTEIELREIRSLLMELNKKVEGMNKLLERSLIECADPLPDEVEATKEYENAKKKQRTAISSLETRVKVYVVAPQRSFY